MNSSSSAVIDGLAGPAPLRIALDIAPYQIGDDERRLLENALGPIIFSNVTEAAGAADVLVTQHIPHNAPSWTMLKLIQLTAAGVDHLEGHPIWRSTIPVTTASGIGHVSIAQYCLAMVLNHYHCLPQAMRFTETRQWPDRLRLASRRLRGLKACIYGYGSIGRECARLLQSVGVETLAVNRSGLPSIDHDYNAWPGTGDPDGRIPREWFSCVQLDVALAQSHLLIVTAPATSQTRGSIDARRLALLPAGALVVIVSRGSIVVESDLAETLRSGHLGGAIVDTFSVEPPPPSHPLFDAPRTLLTPHISGVFDDYLPCVWPLLIENVRRIRSGRRPLNLVEPRPDE